MRNLYKIFVGKPEEKRPLGRPWRKWEDSIRKGLRELSRESVDCINIAEERDQCRTVIQMIMNPRTWEFLE
jgi:hypothetical protein